MYVRGAPRAETTAASAIPIASSAVLKTAAFPSLVCGRQKEVLIYYALVPLGQHMQ